jgi:hypothetical protein
LTTSPPLSKLSNLFISFIYISFWNLKYNRCQFIANEKRFLHHHICN